MELLWARVPFLHANIVGGSITRQLSVTKSLVIHLTGQVHFLQAGSTQTLASLLLVTTPSPSQGSSLRLALTPMQVTEISRFRKEYDQWMHSKEAISTSHPSHHTSSSNKGTAFSTSAPKSETWVINSGASTHMSSIPSPLHLQNLTYLETITIVDEHPCSVTGKGDVKLTSSMSLFNVLYVPNLDVNLLSISAITKALYCSVQFFPYHCVFRICRPRHKLVWVERLVKASTSSFWTLHLPVSHAYYL